MKRYLFLFLFIVAVGCVEHSTQPGGGTVPMTEVRSDKKRESTACAYWKCSNEKKLYMQKYVRTAGGQFRSSGTFKLGQGTGAFPLEDLDKYGSDGESVSIDVGHDPCPYCRNTSLVNCNACGGKTYCEAENATSGTCPWCGNYGRYRSGSWGVGGGG